MELCEQLKKEYLNELSMVIESLKTKSAELKKEDSGDEAILENIKVNVSDIFYKMFNVSYNSSCKDAEDQKIKLKKLYDAYIAFFNKIPAPWKEKMAKDKEHGMMKEYYIEQIKLETADKIKEMFIEYYDRFYREA